MFVNGLLFSLCDANPIGGNLLTTGDRLCKSYSGGIMQILLGGNYANPIGGYNINFENELLNLFIMQILLGGTLLTILGK